MFERISRRERRDLFIAWIAISLAFAIIFIRDMGRIDLIYALILIGVSLVTVGIGFVAHEMAHKFTAIRYGYWAEFRKDNTMLLVAVALAALVGVVFAAPGATLIYDTERFGGGISREQNGKISAAGPVTNLLLCIPFAGLLFMGGIYQSFSGNLASLIGMMGLQVNAMIATFNMLPVSVLDGRKVFAWNKGVFAVLIITAVGLLLLTFYPTLL
ncbi:MAG: peptidase M50 [Methanoregulaceae archaeon]|jgi:Zn-dependent protease